MKARSMLGFLVLLVFVIGCAQSDPGITTSVKTQLIAEAKAKREPKAKADTKPDPVGAVSSFLKKLVTPDKTSRKRAVEAEAEADPPSQVQPPQ